MFDPDDEELDWRRLAICQHMKTNCFYDDYESDPVFAANMDDICLSCPVRKNCLEEGINNKEWGAWGAVYLSNGVIDPARNSHKTPDIWEMVIGDG